MSYAAGPDMTKRYDVRRLGDLVSDTGTRVADPTTDPNLLAALADASGLIDAALLRGGRYLPADLTTLPPAGNSINLLIRLTCDLAFGLLLARRDPLIADLPPQVKASQATLAALAEGSLVFADVPGAVSAGKPVQVQLDSTVSLVSSLDRVFGDLQVNPNNPNFVSG